MEEYLADQNVWVPKAPMIFGRFRFDAAYSGGSIYAFGGEVSVQAESIEGPRQVEAQRLLRVIECNVVCYSIPSQTIYASLYICETTTST